MVVECWLFAKEIPMPVSPSIGFPVFTLVATCDSVVVWNWRFRFMLTRIAIDAGIVAFQMQRDH